MKYPPLGSGSSEVCPLQPGFQVGAVQSSANRRLNAKWDKDDNGAKVDTKRVS